MAKAPDWTQAETDLAVTMRRAGHEVPAIACRVGRSNTAVGQKLFRLGVRLTEAQQAKIKADNLQRVRSQPGHKQRRSEALRRAYSDERRQLARQTALAHRIWEKGSAAQSIENKRRAADQGRAAWCRKRTGWCPAHLRPHYDQLTNGGSDRYSAAEAKRIILDEWLHQLRRALNQIAAITKPMAEEQARQHNSFEAQLERVRSGQARVVPTWRPTRRDDERSLVGCTAALAAFG
jgi:hypothetical protein